MLMPTGDKSGTSDTTAINAAMAVSDRVILGPGTFYVIDTIEGPATVRGECR